MGVENGLQHERGGTGATRGPVRRLAPPSRVSPKPAPSHAPGAMPLTRPSLQAALFLSTDSRAVGASSPVPRPLLPLVFSGASVPSSPRPYPSPQSSPVPKSFPSLFLSYSSSSSPSRTLGRGPIACTRLATTWILDMRLPSRSHEFVRSVPST